MNKSEQIRFGELYQKHVRALKLQGMSDTTIDAYSRAVRRISAWCDCCPNQLDRDQLAEYFAALLESHSCTCPEMLQRRPRIGLACRKLSCDDLSPH